MIMIGSSAPISTDRLAEMVVRPSSVSAYAMPGFRIPSRARSGGPSARNGTSCRRRSTLRTTRLTASWSGSRTTGAMSSSARLLTTVPAPQQAAARISAMESLLSIVLDRIRSDSAAARATTAAGLGEGQLARRGEIDEWPCVGGLDRLDDRADHPVGDGVGRRDRDIGQADRCEPVAEL